MMSKTVRSAVVVAMIGAATLASMGIADAAPLDDVEDIRWLRAKPSRDSVPDDPQQRQVIDYLTEQMRDFDVDAEPSDALSGARPLQEFQATTTTYTSATTRTVVAKVYRRMAGAPPSTRYRSFSYHAGEQLSFDALFRPGATPLPTIASVVARTLSLQLGQPVPVGLDPATYRDFAITDEAVMFFFDQHQLHPALGATAVCVPRSVLAAMLAPGL